MTLLQTALGVEQKALVDKACLGNKPAFTEVVLRYNQAKGSEQAFKDLFPPYH